MMLNKNYYWRCFKFTPDEQLKAAISTREYNTLALEAVQQTLDERKFKMSANLYVYYKNLYESIKPIRGRAEEVRPIGKRRRDWELIEQNEDGAIACRLYQTQVVVYYPNGIVGIKCNTWATPLTAEFIHIHSPFKCYKKYNKLWLLVGSGNQDRADYPVPHEGEIKFHFVDGAWKPVERVMVMKRLIDRTKTKEARAPVQPFLQFAKIFLTMSDGWVMHDTRKQIGGMVADKWMGTTYAYNIPEGIIANPYYGQVEPRRMYKYLSECPEENYLGAMCYLLHHRQDKWEDKRLAAIENYGERRVEFYDHRFTFDTLKKIVYGMSIKACEVHRLEEVDVRDGAIHNVV